jgi:hypothetical protein
MLEYSMLAWLLAAGLLLMLTVPFHGSRNLVHVFLGALQAYLDSYAFVLSLPLP